MNKRIFDGRPLTKGTAIPSVFELASLAAQLTPKHDPTRADTGAHKADA
jgi:hypothetical protein